MSDTFDTSFVRVLIILLMALLTEEEGCLGSCLVLFTKCTWYLLRLVVYYLVTQSVSVLVTTASVWLRPAGFVGSY